MSQEIRLGTEVRDTTVFVYGNWFVGELRMSVDSLGEFVSGAIYDTQVEEDKTCTSCKIDISAKEMNLLLLDTEDVPICDHCRGKLDDKITEVIEENSLMIFSESI